MMSAHKSCPRCGAAYPVGDFYKDSSRNDKLTCWCKACVKKKQSSRRASNREIFKQRDRAYLDRPEAKKKRYKASLAWRNNNKHKRSAWNATNRALASGVLKRMPCEICGETKSQAHHRDYSRPLDITWLCFKHHIEEHGKKLIISETKGELS